MSSTNKGKTDPQLRLDASDELVFPVRAEPTDDTPTIISKSHPTVEPKPSSAADHVTDLAARGNGESLNNSLRGRRLAHFELIEPIGVGGMAAVLRARDTQLDRQVALKILPPEMAADQENVRRFHQEAKAAARLDHENIARVFFCGEDQGLHFIAFEFVEGDNLRVLMERRGRLPVAESVRYVLQIATGLEHASARGVVHRDVKPSNIIISSNGRAKLVDMGLARNLERQGEADLTQSGVTLGTFDYISPEQALEPRDADARSDIYSLGCTFYHMLTGQPPVPEGTAAKKLHHHQHVAPVDPRQFNPDIPDEIAMILGRMMHKDPRARYQRPLQLVQHLMQVARTVGAADDLPEGVLFVDAPLPAGPRNHPLLIVAVPFLALAALITFLALYPSEPPANSVGPAPNGPGASSDQAKGTAPPTDVPPPSVPVSLPGDDQEVADAKALEAMLRSPDFKTRGKIKLKRVIPLKGLALQAGPNQELLITSSDPKAPAKLQLNLTEDNPIGLTVQGGSITFSRVKFEVNSDENWKNATAIIAVSGAGRVVFHECVFEQKVMPNNTDYTGISSVLVKDGNPEVKFQSCTFGLDDPASLGQVAVALNGPARVSAIDCTFRPHASFFHLRRGCDLVQTLVACDHCSGFVVNGPVYRFDETTAATLRATSCLFSRNVKDAVEPWPADLIYQLDDTKIRYVGKTNCYDRLNSVWHVGVTFRNSRELFDAGLKELNNGSKDDNSLVLQETDPSPLLGAGTGPPQVAFQLKAEYADYGAQSGPWGRMTRQVAQGPDLKSNEKLFDPNHIGNGPAIFNNFARAVANLDPGDTLYLKPGKDGREIELPPTALRADVNFTLKAYPKTAPVLTLGKATEKKDLAFFRLLDGKVNFEGLHFVLDPRQDGLGPPSVLLLGDNAQVGFERCVVTLRGPRRGSVLALVNPNELMLRPDQPRFMNSRVDFKSCFLRGDGDLLAMNACRPLAVGLNNSLVALGGSLLSLQGMAMDVTPDQGPRFELAHVSAFAQKPLFSIVCAAKNGKGLAQTAIEASGCLFAPLSERPSLLYLEVADVVSEEQLGKYVKWSVGTEPNCFAKFEPMLALERPNEMGNGMALDAPRWAKLFGEPRAGKGDFTFPLPPETPPAQATPELLRPNETDTPAGGCGALAELAPLLRALPAR